ncbi:MAG: thymidylate synthase [Oscillospiraceae bacterium]|nr:thymidylate synthase [Oscillospiraceae bacterium]
MFELFARGSTLPEAYHNALLALHADNDELPCPDYGTRQKEAAMTFVAEAPLAEPMISKLFIGDPRSLEQYRQEMLDGILDFEVERGNWEYTYHQRMEKQLPWLVSELRRNPDSRRAVVVIRKESDLSTDSPACLQLLQFMIRGGALHCKVVFRSNDAPKAAFMNAYALVMLQERIAGELGVPVGSYTHRANSFHVYERDYEMFDGYVKRIQAGGELAYCYAGDWDEQMEEAKAEIAKMAAELKSRK